VTSLQVVRAGPRTTVQDLGRRGYAHLGVPNAGAVDVASVHAANAAVGNPVGAAVLESTLGGDLLAASGPVTLAVVGSRDRDGVTPLKAGEELRVGRAAGVYVYVAVAGGFDVAPVLGSRSFDTLAGLGPPPLAVGDLLPVGNATGAPYDVPRLNNDGGPLRVMKGPHLDRTPPGTFDALCANEWTVSPQSDRVGLRLAGDRLDPGVNGIASEGLVAGA
jgi:allophanate hydrolase subunit 2